MPCLVAKLRPLLFLRVGEPRDDLPRDLEDDRLEVVVRVVGVPVLEFGLE